jgi:hypothetical protein
VLEESFVTAVIGGFVGGLCLAMWVRDSCSWLRLASSARYLLYGGSLLWIEMLGPIYTHFHNYLAKGVSDPLSNSLDAFRMLVVLSFIALASKHFGTELEGRRVVWIK